jgi:hypothetical protein
MLCFYLTATQVRIKAKLCYDRRSVGQSVSVLSPHLGPKTRLLLVSGSCRFVDVGRPVRREDGSVVTNCRWSSSAVILGFESRETHDYILASQIRNSHKLEDQVSVFLSPRNRVAQLHPHALGSVFVASYYSQRYGGGIQTSLHAG